MAQFTVRNIEDDVRNRLRDLARRHGWSMEEEVRQILRGAVMGIRDAKPRLGSRLARRFAANGLDEDIREIRGQSIDPPSFDG